MQQNLFAKCNAGMPVPNSSNLQMWRVSFLFVARPIYVLADYDKR